MTTLLGQIETNVARLATTAIMSHAALPDGRVAVLFWDRGDCFDARLLRPSYAADAWSGSGENGEAIDLMSVFASYEGSKDGRAESEAWLAERTEDETRVRCSACIWSGCENETLEIGGQNGHCPVCEAETTGVLS